MTLHWVISVDTMQDRVLRGAGAVEGALFDGGVSTTASDFTMTAWLGQYIAITVTGDAYYRWCEAGGDAFDYTTEQKVAASAAANQGIVGRLPTGRHMLQVPHGDGAILLKVAAVSGTIDVRIERS